MMASEMYVAPHISQTDTFATGQKPQKLENEENQVFVTFLSDNL